MKPLPVFIRIYAPPKFTFYPDVTRFRCDMHKLARFYGFKCLTVIDHQTPEGYEPVDDLVLGMYVNSAFSRN